MGRWADRDSDEHRLPEGFQRVGYDADTQTYTYRDDDGRHYEGAPGARYGVLQPASSTREPDPEYTERNNAYVERNNREAIRMFLPFALLVLVFLLLVFRFVGGGGGETESAGGKVEPRCGEGAWVYRVAKGDTCWGIAEKFKQEFGERKPLEGLLGLNDEIDCDALGVGTGICVPE